MNFLLNRRSVLFASLAVAQLPVVAAELPSAATVLNPNHALKLMVVGRRKPGTTLAEHRHHIRRVHGEIVLRYIAAEPTVAPQRYAQHQVFDGTFRTTPPGSDPFALNRDFITQIWFKDMAALGRSRETVFYRDQLQGDENNFVDQNTVVFMPVHEREVSRRVSAKPVGCKLFFFVQKTPGADAHAFQSAWSAGAADLKPLPVATNIQRHVQNDVLGKPGAPKSVDGIDEFWVDDEASARVLLTQWQAWVRAKLVSTGLAVDVGSFALLAQEDLVYAGTR